MEIMVDVMVGQALIIHFANSFAECNNIDDAECIIDQIASEDLFKENGS